MPESLGKILKKIRESKNLSIEEISERTRIPKTIISAIEEEKLNEISQAFYARGFLRSYAQFLGALGERVVQEYLQSTAKKDEPTIVLKAQNKPSLNRFSQYKKQIGLGVLFIFGIWALFFSFIQTKKFIKHISAKHSVQVVNKKEKSRAKSSNVAKPVAQAATTTLEERQGFDIEITVMANTWLQVTSDGELLFKGLLKKGSKETWKAKKEIRLWVGNAGAVTLSLNGKNLGPLGKKGEIKSNIVITKSGIKD